METNEKKNKQVKRIYKYYLFIYSNNKIKKASFNKKNKTI